MGRPCDKCKDTNVTVNDAGVCEKCWEGLSQEDREQQAFKAIVDTKRASAELKDRMDNLKAFFLKTYEGKLDAGGEGKFIILEDTGNGVSWKTKKSSIKKGALVEAGVDTDIIAECTGSYVAFEIF